MITNTFNKPTFKAEYWDFQFFGTGNTQTKEYYNSGEIDLLTVEKGPVNEVYVTTDSDLKVGAQLRGVTDKDGNNLFPVTDDTTYGLQVNQIDFVLDAFGHRTSFRYRMTRVTLVA